MKITRPITGGRFRKGGLRIGQGDLEEFVRGQGYSDITIAMGKLEQMEMEHNEQQGFEL